MAIQLMFIAEDITLAADWEGDPSVHWHILVKDALSGDERTASWTYQELGAVLYLMAGTGEDDRTDQELTALMYGIAEPLFKDWPPSVRPIP
jgi:hypothetical protein